MDHVQQVGPLLMFSYVGMSLRVVLTEFSTTTRTKAFGEASPLNSVALANVVGCFLMGLIQHPFGKKKMLLWFGPHIHSGISTGLAGSLTSFSSWMGHAVRLLFLYYPSAYPPIIEVIWCLLIGFSTSFIAFYVGYHVVECVDVLVLGEREEEDIETHPCQKSLYTGFISLSWVLYILYTIVAIVLAVLILELRLLSLALLSAPFGTLIRYYTSKYNAETPHLPVMTLLVNFTGCILFEILTVTMWAISGEEGYSLLISEDTSASQIYIPALLLGFCGCLTTVSTFINETRKLDLCYNYFYVFITMVSALLPMIGIYAIYELAM